MAHKARFLFSLIALSGCVSKPSQVVDLLRTELKTRGGVTYVDSKPYSGTALALHPSDKSDTLEVRQYWNGKEEGCWKKFYAHRKLMKIEHFESGKKTGHQFTWWENGKLKSDHGFENDELEGESKDWNFDGQLIRFKNYHHGFEEGLQKEWTNDGKLWANYEARNGRNYGMMGTKACATLWDKQHGNVQ